jgi:RNA polymerase sigma factor (sigma-70 family)
MLDRANFGIMESIDRLRVGHPTAADDLLRIVSPRLNELARRMLTGFPSVRSHADSGDVSQGASLRLLKALQTMRPATPRDFFNLASVQIRRELLDLARRYGTRGDFATSPEAPQAELADRGPSGEDLDLWTRFHEAVERLPVEEREAVGLIFYHGKTQAEASEVLGVCERTLQRWWQAGCDRLKEKLGGELPPT